MASKGKDKANGKSDAKGFEDSGGPNTPAWKKAVKSYLTRGHEIREEIKAKQAELKELAQQCQVDCDMETKAFRQLVKEYGYNEAERLKQHRIEESVDQVRNALGWLKDLPLGEHALQQAEEHAEH